jgi:hypothetical protein
MRKLITTILIIIFNINLCIANTNPTCPQTFPETQRIAEREMQKILNDSESNKDIKIQRSNFGSNINVSGNTSFSVPASDDAAIVVFAIIGLVVIIAWIPYAITYLYDLQYEGTTYCPWYRLSYQFKQLKSNSEKLDIDRDAKFHGFQLGISSLHQEYSFFSFVAEVGHHEITDTIDGEDQKYFGEYLMLGPSVVLGKPNKDVIALNLMGGASTNSDVSVIAEAALNWSINLNSLAVKYAPILNLNFGANYLDVKETEGIIKNMNKNSLFWGVGFGFNF